MCSLGLSQWYPCYRFYRWTPESRAHNTAPSHLVPVPACTKQCCTAAYIEHCCQGSVLPLRTIIRVDYFKRETKGSEAPIMQLIFIRTDLQTVIIESQLQIDPNKTETSAKEPLHLTWFATFVRGVASSDFHMAFRATLFACSTLPSAPCCTIQRTRGIISNHIIYLHMQEKSRDAWSKYSMHWGCAWMLDTNSLFLNLFRLHDLNRMKKSQQL